MKFIHAADTHLGHLFQGVKRISTDLQEEFKESTFNAFEVVIQTAIEQQVDFLVLAGDEYDRHKRSLKEQNFLREQFLKLQEHEIDVFIIYGNHDYLVEESTFIEFPENVHVFGENVSTVDLQTKAGEKVAVSGFSYKQQHVFKDYVTDFPSKISDQDYHIGMYHGMPGTLSKDYAPFDIQEMITKGYDYWALGHIHDAGIINQNPPIVYSGDIQGLNRTETGEKGFYLVEMKDGKTTQEFISSQIFIWDEINAMMEPGFTIDDIKNAVVQAAEELKPNTLISINLDNVQCLANEVQNQIEDGEFLPYIQTYLNNQQIYAYKVKTIYRNETLFEDMDESYWDEARKDIFTREKIIGLDKKIMSLDFIKEHVDEDNYIDEIVQKSYGVLNHKRKDN
ncbi:DNA repair exonuclease [Lactobacillus sp. YT155]|uniref:metallophosphoesterase family protein n=1 Tax=Lactobacillus sp. YT155 TaxID=3060955 RepID=UPI00265E1DB2|nr:DNA repair exonuclease [Lactobacillus sp. YT155]MDO1605636.1 DNA repair exonuclease [Lactobacillus sp. YT155]